MRPRQMLVTRLGVPTGGGGIQWGSIVPATLSTQPGPAARTALGMLKVLQLCKRQAEYGLPRAAFARASCMQTQPPKAIWKQRREVQGMDPASHYEGLGLQAGLGQ
mmetsp:Transcript_78088/g.137807  ORF Transcript_78088/g.137807 Transcript_78088/m.137807 type:complete len:106 (-) Transcript_78088:51-368(-)